MKQVITSANLKITTLSKICGILLLGLVITSLSACEVNSIDQGNVNASESLADGSSLPVADQGKLYTPEEQQSEVSKIQAMIDDGLIEPKTEAWASYLDESFEKVNASAYTGNTSSKSVISTFTLESKNPFMNSSIDLTAGKTYSITAKQLNSWYDCIIPASLEGWTTMKWMAAVYAPLAKTRKAGFYYLAGCVKSSTGEYYFEIGRGRTIIPPISGRLYVFVNDVPGFEWNNIGNASITVNRL